MIPLWRLHMLKYSLITHTPLPKPYLDILGEVECFRGPPEEGCDSGVHLLDPRLLAVGRQLQDPPDLLALSLHR